MTQLAAYLGAIAFLALIVMYLKFVFRRLGPNEELIRRGIKLVRFWIAVVVLFVVPLPIALVKIGDVLGLGACDRGSFPDSGRCSAIASIAFYIVCVATLLPASAWWVRFLLKTSVQTKELRHDA
jgi:hypothetical protein